MKFVNVDTIPRKRWDKNSRMNIQTMLTHFMDDPSSHCVRVEVDKHEYASAESLAEVLNQSIKRSGYRINVVKRGQDVFIKKSED